MTDTTAPRTAGFAVLYRWRVRPEQERPFRQAWERVTAGLVRVRGGLGSRLHRAEDGSWLAYAQWPSRAAWEQSRGAPPVDAEAARMLSEAVESAEPPLLLTPVLDLLIPAVGERSE